MINKNKKCFLSSHTFKDHTQFMILAPGSTVRMPKTQNHNSSYSCHNGQDAKKEKRQTPKVTKGHLEMLNQHPNAYLKLQQIYF